MSRQANPQSSEDKDVLHAFLIVEGERVFPLDQPVTDIGRKNDNHIIIDDQHVSRYHAQVRKEQRSHVLIDLDSTTGTSVNGERIQKVVLTPGDVISLGGVPLIFGESPSKIPAGKLRDKEPIDPNTGPTDASDVQGLDNYLNLFEE